MKKVVLPKAELNITAMMDLVLNLITFFVLVANFSSQALPPLDAPHPDRSLSHDTEVSNKVTVNVLASKLVDGDADSVTIGGLEKIPPGDTETLMEAVKKEVAKSANVVVDLRADKKVRYDAVQPVMMAIRQAGVQTVNLVALKE